MLNLEKIAEEIKQNNYVDEGKIQKKETNTLRDFIAAQRGGYTVAINFTSKNDNELKANIGGCTVICPVTEYNGSLYKALDHKVEGRITKIDEENKVVEISAKDVTKNKEKREAEEIYKQILAKLEDGEKVVLPAELIRITGRNKEVGIFSILAKKVIGYMHIRDFTKGFCLSFNDVTKLHEYYDVEIISKRVSKSQPFYFNVSRKNICEDPWRKKELRENYKRNDLVVIKCISYDQKKPDIWWGVCEDIPEIQIMCQFTGKVPIRLNYNYKCYIKKINPDKHQLVAVPICAIADMDNQSVEFLQTKEE